MGLKMANLLVLLALMLAFPLRAAGIEVPRLQSRVTDLAGLLSPEEVSALDSKLRDLEASDSTQVAVLIIPSLEGEALEDFSERVATAWRLGQKGRDNGALLLIALKERGLRIEAGYGLEAKLTDARSRRIIQDEIIPYFRQGSFYQGIDAGVTAIIQTVRGEYQGSGRTGTGQRGTTRRFDWIIALLFPLLWILSATGAVGGLLLGGGAGVLLAYSLAGAGFLPMIAGGILGAAAGSVVGFLVRAGSRSPSGHRSRGFRGPFIFPGGGSSGGGFSGGGGFGGFSGGGGSFGGGGASGRW
jgi:uncharacterized protein